MKALTLLLACCLWTSSALAQINPQDQIARVKGSFVGRSLDDIHRILASKWPPAVSDSERKILLQDLPLVTASNRIYDPVQLGQLAARLRGVLSFYNRLGVVEVIVFNDDRPIVYNKPGVVVVLSTEVLKIVKDDDAALAGVVAHELAHELTAMSMLDALQRRDHALARELELFCDAVVVVMLLAMRMEPDRYGKALERICRHSQAASVLNEGSGTHPSPAVRLKLIAEIKSLFEVMKPGTRQSLLQTRLHRSR